MLKHEPGTKRCRGAKKNCLELIFSGASVQCRITFGLPLVLLLDAGHVQILTIDLPLGGETTAPSSLVSLVS